MSLAKENSTALQLLLINVHLKAGYCIDEKPKKVVEWRLL